MKRCQQRYGRPTDAEINDYGTELALLLKDGFVEEYEFGFKRANEDVRVLSWHYSVGANGIESSDGRPGGIFTDANVGDAKFFNFLTPASAWNALDLARQAEIRESLPIKRSIGQSPRDGMGSWITDRVYSAKGVSLTRKTFRPNSTP
jgi:hypothetical protein